MLLMVLLKVKVRFCKEVRLVFFFVYMENFDFTSNESVICSDLIYLDIM